MKMKSSSIVVVRERAPSSCLTEAHDTDVILDTDEALLVHCVNDEAPRFPMG